MARGESPGIWQLLLTISLFIVPLHAHGRHSSATAHRRHHHANHSAGHAVEQSPFPGRTVLSEDSAERDHLIGLGAGLPVRAAVHRQHHKHVRLDFSEDEAAGGAGAEQPANPASAGPVTVAYPSAAPNTAPSDLARDRPEALQQKAGSPTAWTLSDFYDYLTPDDDLSAVDTTPEPEPSPSPPADMEDENPLLAAASAVPTSSTPKGESRTAAPAPSTPPAPPAWPAPPARPAQPAQPVRPVTDSARGQGSGVYGLLGPNGCRLGFVRSGTGVCVSQCDADPRFCYNGGVCTVVDDIGAFCRCNVQDYIWNKGPRCDWMVTEFQVLCVLVGVGSLVLVLLFMIVVFFAKRLHRLKTENNRLRKRSSKYRPQSEQQTDGFSVSTVTDGSHPNDDPQKTEEAVKSPPKEEECLNIRNSHSPKQENNRPGPGPAAGPGDLERPPNNTEDVAEVNSLQNNLV